MILISDSKFICKYNFVCKYLNSFLQQLILLFSKQIHRRLLHDDAFGVGEALNETGVDGTGLVITGTHYLIFSNLTKAASKHRPLAQQVYMQPEITFAVLNASETEYMKSYSMLVRYRNFLFIFNDSELINVNVFR